MSEKYTKIVAVFIAVIIIILYRISHNDWSTIVSQGKVTGKFASANGNLIFGTNYSKLYIVKSDALKNPFSLDLNYGDTLLQDLKHGKALVISGDTLNLVNAGNGNKIWSVSTEDQTFFSKAVIYKNKVYASSLNGDLSVFRVDNGKMVWRYKEDPLPNISSVLSNGVLYYAGTFAISDNKVYFASRNTIHNFDATNGRELWKNDLGSLITSAPVVFGNSIFLNINENRTLNLSRQSGKILWGESSESQLGCTVAVSTLSFNEFFPLRFIGDLITKLHGRLPIGSAAVIQTERSGRVRKLDSKGKVAWESESFGQGLSCPNPWKSYAMFTTSQGKILILSLSNGKIVFEREGFGTIRVSLIKIPRLFSEFTNLLPPDYLIVNNEGKIWVKNMDLSNPKFIFDTGVPLPVDMSPLVDSGNIITAGSNGVVYKINLYTGKPYLQQGDDIFSVSTSFVNLPEKRIFEITVKSPVNLSNPWVEANLYAEFYDQDGKKIVMPGFYYGDDLWKIRFNPPSKGMWKWKVFWVPRGRVFTKSGQFNSLYDTSKYYLKTNLTNPKRLTVDNVNIFNGLGISDTMYDLNYNGTPLDDWAIGNSESFIATSSSGYKYYFNSDVVNSLSTYLETYGPSNAGFNLFRWNVGNSSQPLWSNLGFPPSYWMIQGKIGDKLVETLKANDYHIWLTLFGNDIPFKFSHDPSEQYLLKNYVSYVYARYGAFVDIWEIGNEVSVPNTTENLIVSELRDLDFEHRPISIGSDSYNLVSGSIIAPHWYESEKIIDSDIKTVTHISEFDSFNKPVVIAEQGNKVANYDETSSLRMRIRAWTSFFDQGILIFWNQSDNREAKAGVFPNANIYLGEIERKYLKVLQDFTSGFPLNSKKVQYSLQSYGVRGYGIDSMSKMAGYFFHYTDPFSYTQFNLILKNNPGGKVEWIDPEDGKIISSQVCPPAQCYLVSPKFKTDTTFILRSVADNK